MVNSYAPHTEKSSIKCNSRVLANGYYHRINRTWQRYDYEMSLHHALEKLLDTISRRDYEYYKVEIDMIKQRLKDMYEYNWSNRH